MNENMYFFLITKKYMIDNGSCYVVKQRFWYKKRVYTKTS